MISKCAEKGTSKRFAAPAALALGLAFATTAVAQAVPNPGIRYPDNSIRYALGYSGLDFPVVCVAKGTSVEIVISEGEQLLVKDNVPVVLDDRKRWVAVGSRSGGQLVSGHHVPVTWSVFVEPSQDADDTWLTINSAAGHRYKVHLIAVDHHSKLAENLVGFFVYHPPQKRVPPTRVSARRQAHR
jgi:hypothetical protein